MKKIITVMALTIVVACGSTYVDNFLNYVAGLSKHSKIANGAYFSHDGEKYGRYGITNKAAKDNSDRCGVTYLEWKKPDNQDKLMTCLSKGYSSKLFKEGRDISYENMLTMHTKLMSSK